MNSTVEAQIQDLFNALADQTNSDVFLISAGINDKASNDLIQCVRNLQNKRENASLILLTFGGSADAAYQITRCLKKHYQKLTLYVFGYCKSAGTLVAVGADQIVMSESGQFGPLDVQLADNNKEMQGRTAALDVQQALATLSDTAFMFFTRQLVQMSPGQVVNTNTAVAIAKDLTLGIIGPIASQIDPLLIGRVERSMRIAKIYSQKLNPQFSNIKKLVEDYPSHEFVIDYLEAKNLFGAEVVREPNAIEIAVEDVLRGMKIAPYPSEKSLIKVLSSERVIKDEKSANNDQGTDENPKQDGDRKDRVTPGEFHTDGVEVQRKKHVGGVPAGKVS